MDRDHMAAMIEATALTRAGRLAEATELIRRTLAGSAPAPDVVRGEIVIDTAAEPRPSRTAAEPRPADPTAERRRPPDDGGAVPDEPAPGTRCVGGGLRGLLREQLGRTVRGAATHLRAPVAPDLDGLPGLLAGRGSDGGVLGDQGVIALPGGSALAGETTAHVHRGAAGARPYLLHVPATGTGPRPLVVLLHGGTQSAADVATATRIRELAEEHGFLVACPEQVTSANPTRHWNWFQPGDQRRGAGEPAILVGIVDEVAAAHEVDRDRVYVAGFSAGAAMAAVLGAAYPDVFVAVGVHSGLPHGCAHDVGSAFAAMRGTAPAAPLTRPVPVITFHGDADPTVAVDNATRVVEQFTGGALSERASEQSNTARPRSVDRAQRGSALSGDTLVERGPGRPATRTVVRRDGVVVAERWIVHGSGHAWSGGTAGGSYTDPAGPDASAEMVRFFAEHPRRS